MYKVLFDKLVYESDVKWLRKTCLGEADGARSKAIFAFAHGGATRGHG